MVKIVENYPLKSLNTFHIESRARYFAEVFSIADIREILKAPQFNALPLLILGGGSNMLITGNFEGLVLKIGIPGINVLSENEDIAYVRAGAGEFFHDLVLFSIENNLGGIENLSLIPGCVGAAPIQNIGAYGVEFKDAFYELEALMIDTGEIKIFTKTDCHFGYRESLFKNILKGKCIIVSVTLRLNKRPRINTAYGAIEEELKARNISSPTLKDISDTIIHIRKTKLPDPALLGNAGSFFKNPTVTREKYEELKSKFPDMVAYASVSTQTQPRGEHWKLAAGWMIEKAGWKGKRFDGFGVHQHQALVLVNYGNASGKDILNLSKKIMEDIKDKFGVMLEREVNVI